VNNKEEVYIQRDGDVFLGSVFWYNEGEGNIGGEVAEEREAASVKREAMERLFKKDIWQSTDC
jgi:hypothetical protein